MRPFGPGGDGATGRPDLLGEEHTDTLVRRNIDEVFDFPTPCAILRGREPHSPGVARPVATFFDAGVVVLTPDKRAFSKMVEWLNVPLDHPEVYDDLNADAG